MDLKYRYGKNTINKMKGVDCRLIILVATYMAMGKKDIGVTYGGRTQREQDNLVAEGKSQTRKGKHILVEEKLTTQGGDTITILESNAIDICAYDKGKIRWDRAYYKDIIEDMREIAKFFRWENDINFGWDFKTLNDPYHISVREDGDGGIK